MVTLINSNGPDPLPTPKQIRFVNNQGQPPTKRRRINAACLTCRRRKTRCAGEHPTCSTCTKNGHVCLGYTDSIEKGNKKEPDRGTDGSNFDADDDEYLDEEPEVDRKRWKSNNGTSKNGIRPFEVPEESSSKPGRMSESTQDRIKPDVHLKSETVDWEEPASQPTPRPEPLRRPNNPRNQSFSTDGGHSDTGHSPIQYHNESHRVPYFRYFGPTAIVPGFKQMVVKVRDRRRSSISATSPSGASSIFSGLMNTMQPDLELGHLEDMPVYDPTDTNDVHPLIIHLVDTFFVHLGSNYPFLRRDKFPKLVQEKRVEPILVDAVCALSARFSDHPIFRKWNEGKLVKSEYGYIYAQRAKSATVDTFPCPSVAAVQACLLMAYDGFGADQDSALWMYLGIALRMAIDLGLTKEDGVRYQGERDPWYLRGYNRKESDDFTPQGFQQNHSGVDRSSLSPEEQKEVEQERIDTFWAVFFLDRAISSGTGRPVTLKDDDFELELPRASIDPMTGWPNPLASLLQIIHLYGRVSDVLNNIAHAQDLTQDKLNKLVQMENELTRLHQRTDPRLRFDANNFQAHVKNGQGTTFILLHFWFHALIIVLHQPTLLTKEGTISRAHQLKTHSRELSMSSAKTIADILAFAELVDPKCFIGNPFTSQPIYIAACAFLKESRTSSSQPPSRDTTPPPELRGQGNNRGGSAIVDLGPSSRHLLLASAANQNYQACYKALKQMHAYWGGVRYILTALDQKLDGQWDCETYTNEEYESARRYRQQSVIARFAKQVDYPASPIPDNGPPLAWSLTGTTNSPNSSLTLLFQNPVNHGVMPSQVSTSAATSHVAPTSAPTPPGNMIYDPIRQSLPETTASIYHSAYPQPNTSALRHSINRPRRVSGGGSGTQGKSSYLRYESLAQDDPTKTSTGTQVPLSTAPTSYTPSSQQSNYEQPSGSSSYPTHDSPSSSSAQSQIASGDGGPSNFAQSGSGLASSGYSYLGPGGASNLHLLTYDNETDIGQHLTSFESTEMLSWFGDYFPGDSTWLFPGDSGMS
ncbi:fungal-specific transcription factor domain-containing protein [Hypoxylon fragiforme]|uniref:fungal-specific transcription factor domain-containing protein n=1 Tax=Hypoxylon fragiforme TaxID=63214 RepID=UPI0020C64196|nr:fungal-specific transcription factor domain-containing protein [Hypoxylon fragiforme]KAI2610795.1 fungal-specific transcription factor domain-containing protein [Hypoxylon fragiforme]